MTTTDFHAPPPDSPPPDAPPPPTQPPGPGPTPPGRLLRRSRGDRVAAGVAGGLGRYFNVDPVLFRVLFAVAAFFGGSGVLAYVLLWALMPEEGAEHAAIDGWLRGLRARNIPVWAAAVIGVLVLWALTLSWWRPATLVPLAVVAVLVAVFATRNARKAGGSPGSLGSSGPAGAPGAPTRPGVAAGAATTAYAPVDLTKPGDATTVEAGGVPPVQTGPSAWQLRAARRRPVWATIFALLLVAMLVIGAVDWLHGVSVAAYFWIAAAILLGGFLVSVIARRTVWFALVLLVPALLGGIATHGVAAGFGDGAGQRTWQPDGVPSTQYRLLAGDARLDLSSVSLTDARTVRVDIGAGQLTIIAPQSLRLAIDSHINAGQVSDFTAVDSGHRNNGWSVHEVTTPATDSTGPLLTVDVTVGMGEVRIVRT